MKGAEHRGVGVWVQLGTSKAMRVIADFWKSFTRKGEVGGDPPDSAHLFPNQHQQNRTAAPRITADCHRAYRRPPEVGVMALPGRTLPKVSRTTVEPPSGRVVLRLWSRFFIGLHS
jgi:hypothetical protein